jgi:hypothetical protein
VIPLAHRVLVLGFVACATQTGVPQAPAVPAPAAPAASTPPATPTTPEPTRITDAECAARGGRVITEETYAHLDRRPERRHTGTPFRVCYVPSPKNGEVCTGEADCAGGRCLCDGELGRPDPQRDVALRAMDGPLPSGSWHWDYRSRMNSKRTTSGQVCAHESLGSGSG